jgi:hypothetical protein
MDIDAEAAKVRWLDVSQLGIVLGRYDGSQRARGAICAVDATGGHGEALAAAGFVPAEGWPGIGLADQVYVSANGISGRRLAGALGAANVRAVELTEEEIKTRFDSALVMRRLDTGRHVLENARPLGVNYAGCEVYESPKGRFFKLRREDGNEVVVLAGSLDAKGEKRRASNAPAFLYADRPEDLARVTDAFARRIAAGEVMKRADFDAMIELAEASKSAYGISRRDFQESLEGSLVRTFSRFADGHRGDPDAVWRFALRLYDGMPTQTERTSTSVAHQQFSTPLPISYLGQRLLGEVAGRTILEPTIGNRSLVSALPKTAVVCGVEIDPKRIAVFGRDTAIADVSVQAGDATEVNFRSAFGVADGFDCTIANPPFATLDQVVKVKVESPLVVGGEIATQRLDHLIVYRTLAARKDSGQSVFIVGADHAIDDGEIAGRTKYLLNYLKDHYHVDGMVDIAGNLYRKMGAAFPIRLLVVGARKAEPAHSADLPTHLRVLRTHDEVREWTDQVLAARAGLAAPVAVSGEAPTGRKLTAKESRPEKEDTEAATADAAVGGGAVEEGGSVIDSVSFASAGEDAALEAALKDGAAAEPPVGEDEFQRGYQPFSKVGEGTTMIPVNLAGPVYEALAGIQGRYGEIDEFVASELDYTTTELGKYFAPEQVDAIALAIAAKKDGRGFLDADQMGVGKGRVLAAMARHARLNDEVPAFVTVKSNLFSDFLERDLVDIGSRHLFQRPFIFNADTKIIDRGGAMTHKSFRPPEFRRCFEGGRLPEGTDIVFLTYSQLSRPEERSSRSKFFHDISMRGELAFLLDEAHNGAGDSYTSENLCKAIENNASPVLYASGTPIKGAKNLRLYSQLLPRTVNYEELLKVIAKDPISLQEALNHEIALSGSLISRELDNRAVVKEFAMATEVERNRMLSDKVSAILMEMSYLCGDVTNLVNERKSEIKQVLKGLPEKEREGSRMNVSSMNFGSRFHAISRQFLLAVKAEQCVREALAAIGRGEKPIIAVQHTGESLLAAAVADARAPGGEELDASAVAGRNVVLAKPVSFKDLLHRYAMRITEIKETGHYGDVSYRKADSKEMRAAIVHIKKKIDELPDDLTLTPLDYFRYRMGQEGFSVGEVSGRTLAARYLETGGVAIESVNNTDKSRVIKTIRDFNNGDVDALVLTASGSTGISCQASPANGRDLRPRVMIKWEPQQDIAVERQMDGRPNRTGQVVPPKYRVLLSGMPADDRLAMMFNNKNRSLTSATVANRDSKELIKNVPDLLNEVGDKIAEEMFYENPKLADMMDVELESDDERGEALRPENYFINRMTGRIMLLPYDSQVKLYEELGRRFNDRIDELNALGENPLQVKCYEWKAEVLSRHVFLGEEVEGGAKSQFDEPVYLTRVKYQREMRPIRAAEVNDRIAIGRSEMGKHALVGPDGNLREFEAALQANYGRWLQESVSVYKYKADTPEAALALALGAEEPNQTKSLREKLDWLRGVIRHLPPGGVFTIEAENGESVPYVVVGTALPKAEDIKRLGEWGVYAVRPGFDTVEHFSMNKLFTHKATVTGRAFERAPDIREVFDDSPSGMVDVVETLLDGNIFEAVAATLRHNLGRKIVYTNAEGIRQHGVLVKHGMSVEKLKRDVAERVRNSAEVMWFLDLQSRAGQIYEGLTTSQDGKFDTRDAIKVSVTKEGDYALSVPGTKAGGGTVYLDPRIARIEGNAESNKGFGLDFDGTRVTMRAYVKPAKVAAVLDFLMREKNIWFYTNDKDLLQKARAEIRAVAEREQRRECAV